ncbi:MAG TPA: DUF6468 domain-containing protein [Acetobacteraceae bacterium]|nr:DUF6468 domain-containing protein [Acetobacteraceae bacterium]
MTSLEWILQLLLLGLLGAAIPYALRLERALAALRQDRAALEGGGREFHEAARLAEGAVQRLRASAEQAGKQVAERIATAEPLRDDLRYLVERAEALADRLDGLVRTARPAAAEAGAPGAPPDRAPASPARSQAERDLLRALVQGMGRSP